MGSGGGEASIDQWKVLFKGRQSRKLPPPISHDWIDGENRICQKSVP